MEPTDPGYVPSGSYPLPAGSGPSARANNYGYPFQVSGPTEPATIHGSQATEPPDPSAWSPPQEYMDPSVLRQFDPMLQARRARALRKPLNPFDNHVMKSHVFSEFGNPEGMHPDPNLDFSGGGSRSKFPIADPDTMGNVLLMRMMHRTDVANASSPMDPYQAGNPDRFGAQPPLVRRRSVPPYKHRRRPDPPRMVREW